MDARDFRGIGRPAQEELRRRALFLIEHEGMTQADAARAVGVHRQTVNIWHKRYRERGEDGLLDGRRVSPRLGLSTVPLYLRRWGLTPQKPSVRAKERPPAAVAAWLERDYPAIARRAKAAGAVIYRGDETGISNQDQVGRSWAPEGRTPVVARTAKRVARSMIAAVSSRGLMRSMLYEGALNADLFLAFLRRLVRDAGREVVLVVDDLKVHEAGEVRAWVASHAHEIELVYLPPYAPDHNPSECLNNDLKQALRQKPQPESKDELIGNTRSVLRIIQRSPERVRAYFKPEPVRYAA